ncbi:MAG: segregation/condensation protein A [Elainellaceae cyanobacterium]
MALSLAQNAIAMLIDLAERGEIDPWDVKVIDVVDRFLSQLQPGKSSDAAHAPYEADLSESGQAFLYASVLVLLKADNLARSESPDADETLSDDEFIESDDLSEPRLPLHLERKLRRRAVARPPQNRRVTLKELITQLELMTAAVAEHRPRVRARRPRPQPKSQAVRAIAQLAHQENLSEIASILEQFLSAHWPTISEGQEWLDFELLLDFWGTPDMQQQAGVENFQELTGHSPQSDRVGVFWALLFLSAQSKVELAQEEFYSDLRVRSLAELSESELSDLSAVALPD